MKIVLRITRHPLDSARMSFLRRVYGNDILVITEDMEYGADPVEALRSLLKQVMVSGDSVVAVEAQAPFPVLMRLVEARRELGVTFIRAQFERDAGGRAIVVGKDESGRDLLKFSHYEELLRIEFDTRRLGS
jgi:hypothetical protein